MADNLLMMRCTKCGEMNQLPVVHCKRCGARLDFETAEKQMMEAGAPTAQDRLRLAAKLAAAAALALASGLACGLVNGAVTEYGRIPSFIVTLGMLEIARGAAYQATDSTTKYIGRAVEWVGAPLPGILLSPAFFAAVALVVAGQVVLSRTVFGRHLVAIGTNEAAVRLSGINPRPAKIAVFAIAGALTGLGAVFQVSRLSSADPNAGVGMELAAIAAVVIGGTSLMGGRGGVGLTLLGALTIGYLEKILSINAVGEAARLMLTGLIIVAAVIFQRSGKK